MNDKEGLEEAKNALKEIEFIKNQRDFKQEEIAKAYFTEKWGDWLIEQAERVQDLEGDAENIYRANHDFSRRNDKLEQQNKLYREALISVLNNDEMMITNQEIILEALERSDD